MTEIEVRRFLRLRNTVLRVSTEPAQGRPEIQRGRSAAKNQTLLDLITKHNQLYKFTTRGNLKTNGRRVKKGRTKARTRKMKRMQFNIDKILSSISPSYRRGGVVTDLDLNEVQLLQLRQVKWIKAILNGEKLPRIVRSEFFQNLKAVVQKAIAEDLSESEDDSRERTDVESSANESGDEEGSGKGRSDESSDKDFEEQEMMTVE